MNKQKKQHMSIVWLSVALVIGLIVAGVFLLIAHNKDAYVLQHNIYFKENKMIIKVDGFEVEYIVTDRQLTIEDFENIELGSSLREIVDKLGDPDTWIGSGMLRPVYFLENGGVVVCYFGSPAALKDLKIIKVIRKNGESQIIKQK